jgi:hypothetical protein
VSLMCTFAFEESWFLMLLQRSHSSLDIIVDGAAHSVSIIEASPLVLFQSLNHAFFVLQMMASIQREFPLAGWRRALRAGRDSTRRAAEGGAGGDQRLPRECLHSAVPKCQTDKYWVLFKLHPSQSNSPVGCLQQGAQTINLTATVDDGIVKHEICHTTGMMHTHQPPDCDDPFLVDQKLR